MNEINGQFGGQRVYELLLDSGEYVYVQPLSIYVVRALQDKALELFPFPEKATYEKPMNEAVALEPGQMIPAEENPEYRRLYDETHEKQQQYVNNHSIAFAVEPVLGHEAMIAKYQSRLDQMRKVIALPDDAWDATLRFCIITSRQDYNRVSSAIMGMIKTPSEEEVIDGMRIFRCDIRKSGLDRSHRKEEPQSAASEDAAETQRRQGTVRLSESVALANTEPDVGKRVAG